MNTENAPVPTRIQSLGIPIGTDTPRLQPGDTIHLEVTLTVESATDGLDYLGKPTLGYAVKSIEGSPGIVRSDRDREVVTFTDNGEPIAEFVGTPAQCDQLADWPTDIAALAGTLRAEQKELTEQGRKWRARRGWASFRDSLPLMYFAVPLAITTGILIALCD